MTKWYREQMCAKFPNIRLKAEKTSEKALRK